MGSGFDGSGGKQSVGDLQSASDQVDGLIDRNAINNAFDVSSDYGSIRAGVQLAGNFLQYVYDNVSFLHLLIPLAVCVGGVGLLLGLVRNR